MRFALVAALVLALFGVGATAQADPTTPPPKHHLTLPLLHKPAPKPTHGAPLVTVAHPTTPPMLHPVAGPPPHPLIPGLHPMAPHPVLMSHPAPHPPGGLPVCHPGAKLCGHSCISAKLTCHK